MFVKMWKTQGKTCENQCNSTHVVDNVVNDEAQSRKRKLLSSTIENQVQLQVLRKM